MSILTLNPAQRLIGI